MRSTTTLLSLAAVLAATSVACERKDEQASHEPPGLPERTGEPADNPADMAQAGPRGASADPSTPVSDEELESFAAVQIKLSEAQGALQQQVQGGKDPSEAQQEFQQQVGQLIGESGLSAARYEELTHRVNQEPELRRRMQTVLSANMK